MLLHLPFALRNIAHAIWPHKTTGMDVIQCEVMNLLVTVKRQSCEN